MKEFYGIVWQLCLLFGKVFLGVFQIYKILSDTNKEIMAGIIGVPTFAITIFSIAKTFISHILNK